MFLGLIFLRVVHWWENPPRLIAEFGLKKFTQFEFVYKWGMLPVTIHGNRNWKTEVNMTFSRQRLDPRSNIRSIHCVGQIFNALAYVSRTLVIDFRHLVQHLKATATPIRRSRFEFNQVGYAWDEVIRHFWAIIAWLSDGWSDDPKKHGDASKKKRHWCGLKWWKSGGGGLKRWDYNSRIGLKCCNR